MHGCKLSSTTWVNPVVKGSCNTILCGAACCKIKVYTDDKNYNLEWCEHFDQKNLKCNIYDTRPDGCRRYPDVNTFLKKRWLIPGCSYYLEEDTAIT